LTVDENICIDRYQDPLSFLGNGDTGSRRAWVKEENDDSRPLQEDRITSWFAIAIKNNKSHLYGQAMASFPAEAALYGLENVMDSKKVAQFARFIEYMLGRRPDEFGLVADAQGFFPISEVLKVLHDEGWPHVRRNHLETLDFHLGKPTLEIEAHLVRARDRLRLARPRETSVLPKLLYVPVRRRAYESVLQHGLRPQGHTGQVVLFADPQWAQKVGQRRDSQPVIVTVNVQTARAQGCLFNQFGETIFLTDRLPAACCRLPRPPKTVRPREVEQASTAPLPKTPGSFILSVDPFEERSPGQKSGGRRQGSKDWKKERRKARRWKENQNKAP
jgi:putative RNA 2'-phosphotransferase